MASTNQFQSPQCYNKSATIVSGSTLSEAIDLSGTQMTGIFVPSTFDGTIVYVQAAPEMAGTYARVVADGADVAITVTAGKPVAISNLALIAGWQYIKLETATAQATTDTVFTLATRPL